MQNGGSRHFGFCKTGDIGYAFYFKVSFHIDEI